MNERARKELGKRIRSLREQEGISQATFASMVSMDRGYLIDIEAGRSNPSFNKLVSIAHGLDVSPSVLLQGVAELPGPRSDASEYRYYNIRTERKETKRKDE